MAALPHLLIVAHGSRLAASNQEIRDLVERLRAGNPPFAGIGCAFLEIEEPSIAQGLIQLIDRGAQAIVVMPYFLAAGRHVVSDIPRQVDRLQCEHPDIDIRIAPYLGQADGLPELLMKQAILAIGIPQSL